MFHQGGYPTNKILIAKVRGHNFCVLVYPVLLLWATACHHSFGCVAPMLHKGTQEFLHYLFKTGDLHALKGISPNLIICKCLFLCLNPELVSDFIIFNNFI